MKILVLSSHTPSLFWFRLDMMQSFMKNGHEVIAAGNEPEAEWRDKFAALHITYRQIFVQRTATNPFTDLKTLRDIKRLINEVKPQKIFAYQAKTVIYSGLALKRNKDIGFYPLIAGTGSVFMAKGFKATLVRTLMKLEYKLSLKRANKVFFQNRDDVKIFVDGRLAKEEQIVLTNGSGVNLEKFQEQPLVNEPVFLCICRLIRDKGLIEYLEAAKRIKQEYADARFMLVGPYDSNPSALREEDVQPYIDAGIVEYFGEQSDVRPFLEQCSVYVLPSYREGTPKTVLEAMACGKAIVTTDAPGCRETVVDGENGYLVPAKNVEQLTEAMRKMIEEPLERVRMAKTSRCMAEERFSVKDVNARIMETMKL